MSVIKYGDIQLRYLLYEGGYFTNPPGLFDLKYSKMVQTLSLSDSIPCRHVFCFDDIIPENVMLSHQRYHMLWKN